MNISSHLTDLVLIKELKLAVKKEQSATLIVLKFLKEVDERVLYVNYNCHNLFTFCVNELGYTEAESNIRLSAMRLLKNVPKIEEKLSTGQVGLAQAHELQKCFNKMDSADVEKKVSCVLELADKISSETLLTSRKIIDAFNGIPIQEAPKKFTLKVGQETYDKLQELKKELGVLKEEDIIDKLCDIVLSKKKSEKKNEENKENHESKVELIGTKNSRYIPQKLKKKIIARANAECEYRSEESGQKCPNKDHLQFHHIIPHGVSGPVNEDNIILVCGPHNKRASVMYFGKEKANQYNKKRSYSDEVFNTEFQF